MERNKEIIPKGTVTNRGVVVDSGFYQTKENFERNEITFYVDTVMEERSNNPANEHAGYIHLTTDFKSSSTK